MCFLAEVFKVQKNVYWSIMVASIQWNVLALCRQAFDAKGVQTMEI
jgi:hypothetical protein